MSSIINSVVEFSSFGALKDVTGVEAAQEAAGEAAALQAGASEAGIAEQRRQFDVTQESLQPFQEAGVGALGQQQALLGLSGQEEQQQAFAAFNESPGQAFLRERGQRNLLRNASAIGGLGCMRGDTRIHTENGLMRICDITSATRVLSWNETYHKYQLSLSGGSFPKGRANLYRVTTDQGEFVASGHHQLFSSGRIYSRVEDLSQGDEVFYSSSLPSFSSDLSQLVSSAGDQHCNQIDVDYLQSCADKARLYGQQLLTEGESDLFYPQEQGDAQVLPHTFSQLSCAGEGGLMARLPAHSHPSISFDPACMTGYSRQFLELAEGEVNQISTSFFEHISDYRQLAAQSLLKLKSRCNDLLSSSVFHSLLSSKKTSMSIDIADSMPEAAIIIGIVQLESEEPYFDMQVADTNNYICESGFIHHNSGNVRSALVQQGVGFAQQDFQNQFGRLGQLAGQGQAATTNLGQFGAQTAGNIANLGIAGAEARASGILGQQQAEAQFRGQLLQGVGQAAGAFSDRKLKKDIKRIGEDENGGLYEFRYINSDILYTGRMAQELQEFRPDAVSMHASGFLQVTHEFAPEAV